jgi:hypothetical protein
MIFDLTIPAPDGRATTSTPRRRVEWRAEQPQTILRTM